MSNNLKQNNIKHTLFNFLVNKFLPFWPLILAFLFACLFAATVFIFLSKTYYESSAALLINDEKKGVEDSEMIESIDFFKTKKIIENELEILGSREIIKKVVDRLALYAPVYEASSFREVSAYESSPIRVVLQDPSSRLNYEEDVKHPFEFNTKNNQIIIDNLQYPLDEWVNNPFGGSNIKFIVNPNYILQEEKKEFYFKFVQPRLVTESIYGILSAKASSKLSSVVRLTIKNETPRLGEDILKELIEAYKLSAFEDRDAVAKNTLDFIESRMGEVGEQLEKVEKELENYRSKEGVIDLSKQGNLYLQNVGEYDKRVSDIDIQLSILNKVSAYVRSKGNSSGIVPSTMGVNDPILSQLLGDLYDAEIEYSKLKRTTAENNPILVSIRNRIEKIRPSISEIVNNQKASLRGSKDNLTSSSSKYNEALKLLPEQERKLIEITRRKENVSGLYEYLVQKREETALSYAPTSNDVKIIEAPQTTLFPVSPKKTIIYLMTICLALGISMAAIGGRELISTKILFRSELENYIDLPIIGELAFISKEETQKIKTTETKGKLSKLLNIFNTYLSKLTPPTINRKEGLLKNVNEDIFIVDQYRQILSYLGFYNREDSVKKLMITSSIQGEGKSYVSSNLAQTLAFSGKKVLLLDMDLRNRKISSQFNFENENGISDYLSDKTPLQGLIKRIDNRSLFVLPAGTKAINSSELLASKNLDTLFKDLEEHFDYILIDTPPINMVSDAQILNYFCDKSIVVVRHAFTPKFVIEHLDENVKSKSLKNCFVVFNGIKSRGVVKDNYGFGYGYGNEA